MTNTDQPYEQWLFLTRDAVLQELLIALLDDCGFEGFEQRADGLLAAAPAGTVDGEEARRIADAQNVPISLETVQPQNWNARWEADYQPVIVPGWCAVRAQFHKPVAGMPHEVIITPKMSFGTGHHATTWLMLDAMRGLRFGEKPVLDFGTGTGVLAILAAKLGAAYVTAIDNDAWSVENAMENVALNGVDGRVSVVAGTLEAVPSAAESFDIILANINRHVLLGTMRKMRELVKPGGVALISGLLKEDEDVVATAARAAGFRPQPACQRGGWILIRLDA